jgi:hypothetical protein
MKTLQARLLKISELNFDPELYPRLKTSWLTAYQYAEAMKAGAIFPPITVGVFEGKPYVIDGWHRVEAKKLLNEEYISAYVRSFESKAEMFAEAVKLNAAHGRPLTTTEKVRVIDQLEKYGFQPIEISKIVGVPIDKISLFKARIIRLRDGTPIYGKAITIKAAEKAGGNPAAVDQSKFIGRDLTTMLQQIIEMIEGGIYPFEDKNIAELTVKLYTLIKDKLQLT